MIYCFAQFFMEPCEVFFIEENFVSFEAFAFELFGALGDRDVKIITFGLSDIEKICSPSTCIQLHCANAIKSAIFKIHLK